MANYDDEIAAVARHMKELRDMADKEKAGSDREQTLTRMADMARDMVLDMHDVALGREPGTYRKELSKKGATPATGEPKT